MLCSCPVFVKSHFSLCIRFISTYCSSCCPISVKSHFSLCIRLISTCCSSFCLPFLKLHFFLCFSSSARAVVIAVLILWSRSSLCSSDTLSRIIFFIVVLLIRLSSLDTCESFWVVFCNNERYDNVEYKRSLWNYWTTSEILLMKLLSAVGTFNVIYLKEKLSLTNHM